MKTLLETRPIFHKCDETIRGHVFCSFLALLLRKELQDRLEAQGETLEWAKLLRDLEALQYTEVEQSRETIPTAERLGRVRPPLSFGPSAWRFPRAYNTLRSRRPLPPLCCSAHGAKPHLHRHNLL